MTQHKNNRDAAEPARTWTRITFDPAVMSGKPCIRGLRVTVTNVIGLMAAGRTHDEILEAYPYVEADDLRESLAYAVWRVQERDLPFSA